MTTPTQGRWDGLAYVMEGSEGWQWTIDLRIAAKYEDAVGYAKLSTENGCTAEQYQRFSDVFDALKKAGLV
jgi:heme oxygenase